MAAQPHQWLQIYFPETVSAISGNNKQKIKHGPKSKAINNHGTRVPDSPSRFSGTGPRPVISHPTEQFELNTAYDREKPAIGSELDPEGPYSISPWTHCALKLSDRYVGQEPNFLSFDLKMFGLVTCWHHDVGFFLACPSKMAAFIIRLELNGVYDSKEAMAILIWTCFNVTLESFESNMNCLSPETGLSKKKQIDLITSKCMAEIENVAFLLFNLVLNVGTYLHSPQPMRLLHQVLEVAVDVIMKSFKDNKGQFGGSPLYRFFESFLQYFSKPEPLIQMHHKEVFLALGETFRKLGPSLVPGFVFAWAELISNRNFVSQLLAERQSHSCYHMYQTLIEELLKCCFNAGDCMDISMKCPAFLRLYGVVMSTLHFLKGNFPGFLFFCGKYIIKYVPSEFKHVQDLILLKEPKCACHENIQVQDNCTPGKEWNRNITMNPNTQVSNVSGDKEKNSIQTDAFSKNVAHVINVTRPGLVEPEKPSKPTYSHIAATGPRKNYVPSKAGKTKESANSRMWAPKSSNKSNSTKDIPYKNRTPGYHKSKKPITPKIQTEIKNTVDIFDEIPTLENRSDPEIIIQEAPAKSESQEGVEELTISTSSQDSTLCEIGGLCMNTVPLESVIALDIVDEILTPGHRSVSQINILEALAKCSNPEGFEEVTISTCQDYGICEIVSIPKHTVPAESVNSLDISHEILSPENHKGAHIVDLATPTQWDNLEGFQEPTNYTSCESCQDFAICKIAGFCTHSVPDESRSSLDVDEIWTTENRSQSEIIPEAPAKFDNPEGVEELTISTSSQGSTLCEVVGFGEHSHSVPTESVSSLDIADEIVSPQTRLDSIIIVLEAPAKCDNPEDISDEILTTENRTDPDIIDLEVPAKCDNAEVDQLTIRTSSLDYNIVDRAGFGTHTDPAESVSSRDSFYSCTSTDSYLGKPASSDESWSSSGSFYTASEFELNHEPTTCMHEKMQDSFSVGTFECLPRIIETVETIPEPSKLLTLLPSDSVNTSWIFRYKT